MHSNFLVVLIAFTISSPNFINLCSTSPTPIQNAGSSSGPSSETSSKDSFSQTLQAKNSAMRRDDSSTLLRQFIAEFLRAMRMTLQDDGLSDLRARSAKLEQSSQAQASTQSQTQQNHATITSSFQFPESEQVVKQRGLPFSNNHNLVGSNRINKGIVERVPRPTPTITNIQLLTKENISNQSPIIRKAKADPNFPPPTRVGKSSTIMSQPLRIVDGPKNDKRGRSLKEIEVQGVKIIVGERVPDSPEDKFFTWRNARVIKGVLVPNDNDNSNNKMQKSITTSSGTVFTKSE